MNGTNRHLQVHLASGRRAVFEGAPWRAVGRTAYLSRGAAERALPDFLRRCREPLNPLSDPDPETVTASVAAFELVDDVFDRPVDVVYMLQADGASAVFSGTFHAICRRAFTDREAACREQETFHASCRDPAKGIDYAMEEGLRVRIVELSLDASDQDQGCGTPPTGPLTAGASS